MKYTVASNKENFDINAAENGPAKVVISSDLTVTEQV